MLNKITGGLRFVAPWVMLAGSAWAQYVQVWQLGDDNVPTEVPYRTMAEFSAENFANDLVPGRVTRIPGDPLYDPLDVAPPDDDFYFAGNYPAGFNGLTAALPVPNPEPATAWERAHATSDRTNRIHFVLSSAQAAATARLRLTVEYPVGGETIRGVAQSGMGLHDMVIRWRNSAGVSTVVHSNRLSSPTLLTLEMTGASVSASAGPNTIEFVRVGPIVSGTSYWIGYDFVRLESEASAASAGTPGDADGDGLPAAWERDNYLSDTNPSDATSDLDFDGLTARQEYNGGVGSTDPNRADTDRDGLDDARERQLGTNPLSADTDGDGLSDREEVEGQPSSSPLAADTDGDGARDYLERRMGTNPRLASSRPNPFRGGIGINFVSTDTRGRLGSVLPAGPVPQRYWNETIALPTGGKTTGNTADIQTPTAGQIVKSDGTAVPGMTLRWSCDNTTSTRNSGSPDQVLMNGLLRASTTVAAIVTVSNVPFARYDLWVVVGGVTDAYQGRLRLGGNSATDRLFEARSTAPQSTFIEVPPGSLRTRPGNVVCYTNLTSRDLSMSLLSLKGWGMGIHAIQIVDRQLDSDGSGIPDWWEVRNGLQPASTALVAADTDGDGLTNLQEYQRGTDPQNPDTDGDGLRDGAESAANATRSDSDGDGLGDAEELSAVIPSNPSLADTDGDGVSDGVETQQRSDPSYNEASSSTFTGWVPRYTASPAGWEWNLQNVQLVWDHGTGALKPNEFYEGDLVSFGLRNSTGADYRSMLMGIRYYKGLLTHRLQTEAGGAFSAPGRPGTPLREAPTGGRVEDLTAALGFSGHGPVDISDRLRFRLRARRGTGNSWTLTYEIWNQTRDALLVQRIFSGCTAAASVDTGSARWMDASGVIGRPILALPAGVTLFFTPTPLENRPAFAPHRDSDNDGMPDAWEDAHGLQKLVATDALEDLDTDGLGNRDEFLHGTNPRVPDSDGDGFRDGLEVAEGSSPSRSGSRPQYAGVSWPTGEDLNGDGLPDAWQIQYRAFGLSPNSDTDGDGSNNAQEALWGTNPRSAGSRIALTFTTQAPDVILSWPHQPLKQQTLFWKAGSADWVRYSAPPLTTDGISRVRLPNRLEISPTELYRVDTTNLDSDGDGVSDWTEGLLGSDPRRPNSTRSALPVVDASGAVVGSVSGDYARMVETLRPGIAGGHQKVSRLQAARFLRQATFGPTPEDLDRVQELGFAGWIDDQIGSQPATLHSPYIRAIFADAAGPKLDRTYSYIEADGLLRGANVLTSFARGAIRGPDQLRQRVAFALSQILVISRRVGDLVHRPLAVADFHDIFVRHAFGNYNDVLREVTFHAAMGHYLSHVGNQKAIPSINQFPDENYAREVKQLFTIGLWELNPDGTRVLNALGQPVPTYGNREITEFARVFTGLWFGGQVWGGGGFNDPDLVVPMEMWPDRHDFGSKTLLRGFVIPARTANQRNGERDVEDALRHLVNHPNCAPFLSRQLIQFLVTSNPSSNYVSRVSSVFANDGTGRRG
ncbi:MAG: DUF1800 family protein, partial [Verrucomicrobia bacterium]|nr:DUF1800 family protein [Verrucomicrobiota bacterium]